MKKIFSIFLALVASVGIAKATIIEGSCGDNLTWSLNTEDSTLSISGSGEMTSNTWYGYRSYIKYISLPDGISKISESAFTDCHNFTSINIPNTVTIIGDRAFSGCRVLTSIVIPNSVTSIEDYTFYNCTSLTSVTIPNSITSIGNYSFYQCCSLTSVELPNSVTSIGNYAFEFCNCITNLKIPNNITSIGTNAFGNVPNIEYFGDITGTPWGAKSINGYVDGYLVFNDESKTIITACSASAKDITIPTTVLRIGRVAFNLCNNIRSILIPDNVTFIDYSAFMNCKNLMTVDIGENVRTIEGSAFLACDSLKSINVSTENMYFSSHEGVLFDKQRKKLIQYPGGKKGSYEIPGNVTQIWINAFRGCQYITEVVISEKTLEISGCAFQDCIGLASVTISSSVISIESGSFEGCINLKQITNYASTPQSINMSVFHNVDKSTCTLYVPKESVDLYKAADGWKEFINIVAIPDSIETIEGDYTIYYMDKENQNLSDEVVTLHVPSAPSITGFTFVEWRASGTLEDGIILQAVYQADIPSSAPEVYPNPANPAQKLIKNGNVYILSEDKTYTIIGQQVK